MEVLEYTRLSYDLGDQDPIFPGNPRNKIVETNTIDKDGFVAHKLELFTHNGTHIDLPSHYLKTGKDVTAYNINDFIFKKILLKKVDVKPGGKIEISNLEKEKDLLLIKTDLSRGNEDYLNPPFIDEETAKYIVGFDFKCLGIDCLSVSNPNHIKIGERVHKILLKNDIFILEDLNLSDLDSNRKLFRLYVIPFFIKGIESSPCTVFGKFKQG